MTDEEYIEKLILKGFEQRQVNQLLKIYTYTKQHNLDLSGINLATDENILRKIVSDFKKGKYEDKNSIFFYYLNLAVEKEFNVLSYFRPEFTPEQMSILIISQQEGFDISQVLDPKYDAFQLRVLVQAIKEGYNIDTMCNENFSVEKMNSILSSYRAKIDITPYLDDFSAEQLDAMVIILERCKIKGPINVFSIFNKDYSVKQMYLLEAALRNNLDITLLSKTCYSDSHLNSIYELLCNDIDPEYIEDTELTQNQIDSICRILLNEDRPEEFDISMILDKKYDWPTIDTFGAIVTDTSLVFELPKMLNKNYSFEKIQEIWVGICKDLDIDKYKDLDDIREIHFVRRMLEYQKNNPDFDITYYLDQSVDIKERMETYVKSKIKEIKYEKNEEEKKCDFSLSFYGEQQYFLTEKNTIVEIGYDYDYVIENLDLSSCLNEGDLMCDFLDSHTKEINEVIRDFFILRYDKESDSIEVYDIFDDKVIEKNVNNYYDDCIIDYTVDDDYIYDDLVDDSILSLEEDYTEKYEPAFTSVYDLKAHGGPNIDAEVLIEEVNANYEKNTLSLNLEQIKEIYGEINDENMNKAYNLLLSEAKLLEEYLEGYNFYYKEYNMDGEEIDSCWGFVGREAIVDIEINSSKFIKDLGCFDDIEECLDTLKEYEEER